MHRLARRAWHDYVHRRLDRRDLLRTLALLGVSASTLPGMIGTLSAQEDGLPFPADDPKAKEGGVLRIVMPVRDIADPAHIDSGPIMARCSSVWRT